MRYCAIRLVWTAVFFAGGALVLAQSHSPPPTLPQPPPKVPPAQEKKLEELIGQALKDNPDVKVAEAKLREAEAELSRTRLVVVQKVITFHTAVELARKRAEEAQRDYQRLKELSDKGTVPANLLKEAERNLARDKADLSKLETDGLFLWGEALRGPKFYPLLGPAILEPDNSLRIWTGEEKPRNPTTVPEPMAEKLRKALETPVKVDFKEASFADVLEFLQKTAPGLNFRNTLARHKEGNPPITLQFTDSLPIRAVLQALEDEFPKTGSLPGVQFVVREYGILVAPSDAVPSGAVLLREFLRGEPSVFALSAAANRKNPPPGQVEGVVKQVETASGLVTVSVGSDAGVQKGHTLEVFRLKPQPRYVGSMVILEVTPSQSVGRMQGKKEGVQTGDLVAGKILGE